VWSRWALMTDLGFGGKRLFPQGVGRRKCCRFQQWRCHPLDQGVPWEFCHEGV